jgi:hypothetical protein
MKKSDLIAHINSLEPEPQREDEITAKEYADAMNITIAQADYRLNVLVQSGKMNKRKTRVHGKVTSVYGLPIDTCDKVI